MTPADLDRYLAALADPRLPQPKQLDASVRGDATDALADRLESLCDDVAPAWEFGITDERLAGFIKTRGNPWDLHDAFAQLREVSRRAPDLDFEIGVEPAGPRGALRGGGYALATADTLAGWVARHPRPRLAIASARVTCVAADDARAQLRDDLADLVDARALALDALPDALVISLATRTPGELADSVHAGERDRANVGSIAVGTAMRAREPGESAGPVSTDLANLAGEPGSTATCADAGVISIAVSPTEQSERGTSRSPGFVSTGPVSSGAAGSTDARGGGVVAVTAEVRASAADTMPATDNMCDLGTVIDRALRAIARPPAPWRIRIELGLASGATWHHELRALGDAFALLQLLDTALPRAPEPTPDNEPHTPAPNPIAVAELPVLRAVAELAAGQELHVAIGDHDLVLETGGTWRAVDLDLDPADPARVPRPPATHRRVLSHTATSTLYVDSRIRFGRSKYWIVSRAPESGIEHASAHVVDLHASDVDLERGHVVLAVRRDGRPHLVELALPSLDATVLGPCDASIDDVFVVGDTLVVLTSSRDETCFTRYPTTASPFVHLPGFRDWNVERDGDDVYVYTTLLAAEPDAAPRTALWRVSLVTGAVHPVSRPWYGRIVMRSRRGRWRAWARDGSGVEVADGGESWPAFAIPDDHTLVALAISVRGTLALVTADRDEPTATHLHVIDADRSASHALADLTAVTWLP